MGSALLMYKGQVPPETSYFVEVNPFVDSCVVSNFVEVNPFVDSCV